MKRYRHQDPSYTKLRRASGTPDWSSYGYTPQYKRGKRTPRLRTLRLDLPPLSFDETYATLRQHIPTLGMPGLREEDAIDLLALAYLGTYQPSVREIQPGVWQYTFTSPETPEELRKMLERGPISATIERDEEG